MVALLERVKRAVSSPKAGAEMHELNLHNETQAIEYVRRIRDKGHATLQHWRWRAARNLEWASGNQNINLKHYHDPEWYQNSPIPDIYTNWLRQYLLAGISRVLESPVTWRSRPLTDDEADIQGSRAIDQILPVQWDMMKMDDADTLRAALWVTACTGIMFAHPIWDTSEGEDKTIPASELSGRISAWLRKQEPEVADQNEKRQLELFLRDEYGIDPDTLVIEEDGSIVSRPGKLSVEWFTGFDVIEDFSTKRFDESGHVAIRRLLTVPDAIARYGDGAEDLKGRRTGAYRDYLSMASTEANDGESDTSPFQMVEVWSLWVAQSGDYENGYFVDVSLDEGVFLDGGENPYDHKRIPVVRFVESPDPNGVRPSCLFDDLVPIQASVNKIDKQIIAHINQTVDEKFDAQKNSIDEDWGSDPDAIVDFYNFGAPPPERRQPAQLAPHVLIEKQDLIRAFKELAGLTDPNLGQPSGQATSGRAILALQDRSDRLSSTFLRNVESGLRDIGRFILELWIERLPPEHQFRIPGEDTAVDLMSLLGESEVARRQNDGRPAIERWDIALNHSSATTSGQRGEGERAVPGLERRTDSKRASRWARPRHLATGHRHPAGRTPPRASWSALQADQVG